MWMNKYNQRGKHTSINMQIQSKNCKYKQKIANTTKNFTKTFKNFPNTFKGSQTYLRNREYT